MSETGQRARRHWKPAASAVALVVVLVAAAVVANTAGDDDKPDQQVTPTGDCERPASLTAPPELPAGQTGDWKRLSLKAAGPACFTLVANVADAAGVAPDTGFTLTGDLPAAEAKERLKSDPPVPLEVTGAGKGKLKVQPAQPLAEDTVYRFTLSDAAGTGTLGRWSFQSRGRLAVVQTLPADRATGVPLNVGLELTFSHDNVSGADDLLNITPPTEGRTEMRHRTLVFIPKSLQPETLYTVTLKAGAEVTGSDQRLTEDRTFRFETGRDERNPNAPPAFVTFARDVVESPTAEAPVLGVVGGGPDGQPPARMAFEVFRFPKVDDFVTSLDGLARQPDWSAFARARYAAKLEGLSKVATFEADLEKGGPAGEMFVRFPQKLPPGWYLATAKNSRGGQAQAWLQVTDLAPYAAVSATRTVVWVNDLATKKAAGGVRVRMAGSGNAAFSATTGDDGVALFDTPKGMLRITAGALGAETERATNLIVGQGARQVVIPLALTLSGASTFSFRENEFLGDPGRFWRILQSDRTLYRTTDTVNVWGLIRPRQGALGDENVTVVLTGFDEEGGQSVVARTTVPRNPSGTFLGKLALAGAAPGYYTLEARLGKNTIANAGVEVRDFVKPAYRLDVVPSKRAIFHGDEVAYGITASFFEGTPVPGVRLKVATGGDGPGPEVTTDPAGRATVTQRPGGEIYGNYRYDSFSIRPATPEEGEITGSAEVRIFPAGVLVQAESERKDGNGVVTGRTFGVDLGRANSEGRDVDAADDYEGPPAAGVEVKAEVVETSYQAIETGDYYDFIAKAVRKTYRYEEVVAPVATRTLTTDAKGRFEFSFPAPADKTFRIMLSTSDNQGRQSRTEQYLGSGLVYPDFTQLTAENYRPKKVGDPVTAVLSRGATELPEGGDNRYLFVKAQQGIRAYDTGTGPRYTFPFGDADVPSVSVLGVRFTGATYDVPSEPLTVFFDEATRKLDVDVSAAKPRYAPGQKAEINVKVTDAAGKPAAGAEVLLSAVDERVFLLSESSYLGQVDALSELYRAVASGLLGGYASHLFPGTGPGGTGAEAGEGGDARSDFRDAVLFETVRTGKDGTATAAFDLPDDLTSWRVSGVAVTDDLRAGTGVALVPVGLPVFADLGMAESYLVDDRPVLRLRAFGDALADGDPVTFSLTAPTLLDAPIETKSTAFQTVGVPLPQLKEGRHRVTVKVAATDRSGTARTDTLTRTLPVLRSRFTEVRSTFSELAEGKSWTPPGGDRPVRQLVVSDHNRGRFYPDLVGLAWTPGDRVDQALARDLADGLLAEYFGEGVVLPSTFRGSAYQAEGGGITILPFSDQDLMVSARIAALAPDRFGRSGLVKYFNGVLDDPKVTRERAFIALYGLAGLREPVLASVQQAVAADDLTVTERLLGGLAAATLGDEPTGRRLYRSVLEEAGQSRGPAVRVNLPDADNAARATALAAVLGAHLADPLAPRLEAWAVANPPAEDLVELDRISFLTLALPRSSAEPVKFSYTLGGDRVEEELQRGASKVLAVAAADMAGLDLKVDRGTLGIAERTLVPVDPATVKNDPALSVTRRIPASIGAADLVRVELTTRTPARRNRCHQVTDLLPSGLRVVTEPYRFGQEGDRLSWPYAVDGQRVSFCAGDRPIVYLARVVSAGSYAAEPAVIRSASDPGAVALSAATRIEIK